MGIVDDFGSIKAGLEKLEKRDMPRAEPQSVNIAINNNFYWGIAGVVMRNKDTNEFVHCVPNTRYDLTIWEVYSIEGIV